MGGHLYLVLSFGMIVLFGLSEKESRRVKALLGIITPR